MTVSKDVVTEFHDRLRTICQSADFNDEYPRIIWLLMKLQITQLATRRLRNAFLEDREMQLQIRPIFFPELNEVKDLKHIRVSLHLFLKLFQFCCQNRQFIFHRAHGTSGPDIEASADERCDKAATDQIASATLFF